MEKKYRDLIKGLIAATKKDKRRRNSQYTFSKEPSKRIRLKWRIKLTITE